MKQSTPDLSKETLRLSEMFLSIQGESLSVGKPTVFIRLTGCPLRCNYCDTAYAFQGGTRQSIEAILTQVASYHVPTVLVTGGEPLAQPNALPLMTALCDAGYQVGIETSGALDIANIDPRVTIILDLKTPASNEAHRNRYANLPHLKPTVDQIKFVICDQADYAWAKQIISTHQLTDKATVLFSPSYKQLSPTVLAEWILNDRLAVRLQIQLHKLLWGDMSAK